MSPVKTIAQHRAEFHTLAVRKLRELNTRQDNLYAAEQDDNLITKAALLNSWLETLETPLENHH